MKDKVQREVGETGKPGGPRKGSSQEPLEQMLNQELHPCLAWAWSSLTLSRKHQIWS